MQREKNNSAGLLKTGKLRVKKERIQKKKSKEISSSESKSEEESEESNSSGSCTESYSEDTKLDELVHSRALSKPSSAK
ncbi:hypothetical protein PIB30_082181 [Stylosanthes scabra]|uniref:Uncharacterized protein n=1 Tax=Stylosanthes scabra TaxID=79078 RepID=A0ABU6ZR72_9FABA|nr:hypothetical protein [Stylosanthes scabra]